MLFYLYSKFVICQKRWITARGGQIFLGIDFSLEEITRYLSDFENTLHTATGAAGKRQPETTLSGVVAFARMLNIARMKGECEVAM